MKLQVRVSTAPGATVLLHPHGMVDAHERKQVKVLRLINAYRTTGHQKANLQSIGIMDIPEVPTLTLEGVQAIESDLDAIFSSGSVFGLEQHTREYHLAHGRDLFRQHRLGCAH